MIPGKYSGLVTCLAAAGMGMFVAMWLLDFAVVRTNWCAQTQTNCFREWVGALSGWIAAAGALVAAGLTLPHLKKQAEEAKRQADFVLGESLPTFDVYAEGYAELDFRIVNWNRRTFLVDEITIEGAELNVQHVELSHAGLIPLDDIGVLEKDGTAFAPSIRIAAFDDRNTAPAICTIKATVMRGAGLSGFVGHFTLHGRLLGEDHGDVKLRASAQILT